MAITPSQLRAKLLAGVTTSDEELLETINTALDLLRDTITEAGAEVDDVPPTVFDRCHLLIAVEMFNQDKAPNGVLQQQYDAGDMGVASTAVRISRDPLIPALPLLQRYIVTTGIA